MEQIAFRILALSIALNLATGLFAFIGGGVAGVYKTGNIKYTEDLESEGIYNLETAIGSAPVENSDNWGDKILDFFSLGLYSTVKTFLNNLLFGFLNFLFNAGIINDGFHLILSSFFSFIYIAGAYELFTGKSILGG